MRLLKLFINVLKFKIPIAEIFLILLGAILVRLEFKYDILIMIAITLVIKEMDNEVYEILLRLPNKMKDIIKIRFLTLYLSILIGCGIGILLFNGSINSNFYSLYLILIFINIITPLMYTKGMKIINDPLSYILISFTIIVFLFITYPLSFSNQRLFNDMVGLVLVIVTLIISYKLSFLRIYGKGSREERNAMDITKVMKIMSIELEKNWMGSILISLLWTFIFTIKWINTKDVEFGILDASMYFVYIVVFSFMALFKSVISKNNKINKELEQIILILPVEKEERIMGRLINSGLVVYCMIIPYVIMYITTPSVTKMIGVRGGLAVVSVYVVVWSTIRNISKYNKKYNMPSSILGVIFIGISLFYFTSSIIEPSKDILIYLYSSEVCRIIGNTYIGIILGILTLIAFYYFNSTYVRNGIKNNSWQIR